MLKALENGVDVKMITGDQVLIAKEMSRILGLRTNIPDASGLPKLDEDGKVGSAGALAGREGTQGAVEGGFTWRRRCCLLVPHLFLTFCSLPPAPSLPPPVDRSPRTWPSTLR